MQIPPKRKSSGKYDPQLKIAVALEYLTTDQGYKRLSAKYNIPHTTVIGMVRWYRQKYPDDDHVADVRQPLPQNRQLDEANLKITALQLLIENAGKELGVDLVKKFGKTRQAFYDHSWRQTDERMQEALIVDLVRSIRMSLPHLGGLKLLHILKSDFAQHHISIGRDSFFALLKKHDLLVKRRRRYVHTTNSNHHYKKWPDLTRNLEVKAAEQLWVSDITYLITDDGFIYLSLITDAYSHKIVGYHLSQTLKAQGCLISLNKAIASLSSNSSLIHHSDRGIQYCCDPYVKILEQNNIAISMTQTGNPKTTR